MANGHKRSLYKRSQLFRRLYVAYREIKTFVELLLRKISYILFILTLTIIFVKEDLMEPCKILNLFQN